MKTLKVCFFAIVTTFHLAASEEEFNCGEAKFVQVFDEIQNTSKLHFPWAGTIFSLINQTEKFVCGTTLLTKHSAVTGKSEVIFKVS
jgi:hypothetical protein